MNEHLVEEETEKAQLPAKRRGPMLGPERLLKKTRFAKLLLDPNHRYTREEICNIVGISENTYYQWSKDPALPDLAGVQPDLLNMRAKLYAAQLKEQALFALEDVMSNNKANPLARVRAAEVILGLNTELDKTPDESDKKAAEQIVQQLQPVFVIADHDALHRLSTSANEENDDGDEVVDGDFSEVV